MKTKLKKYIQSIVILAVAVLCSMPQNVLAVTNQSLAAPLFEQPGKTTFWDDIRAAGSASVPFVVAKPNNGPGTAALPVYTDALAKNDAAGMRTLGYVQVNYQARPFKESLSDVDAWYRLYPKTKGIYIDLVQEGGPAEACYVAALYSHIKNTRPNDLVILSPNGHISAAYEPYGDIFVNANSDFATYKAWHAQYQGFEDKAENQNRFWHMVFGVNPENYSSVFDEVRSNNAGWTYITDKTAPTPFTATPAFWQNEASDVGALPASVIPNRGKTSLPRGCISLSSSADTIIDTQAARQATSKSTISVSNTSQLYDSEATTSVQFVTLPKGVSLQAISAPNWSCNVGSKTCTYGGVIAASSATPKLTSALLADCEYAGGDAKLRLTNYAGNRWDLKVPVKAPFGCDAAAPAGKLNRETSGQVLSQTTQSVETTPEIAPLTGPAVTTDEKEPAVITPGMSGLKLFGIIAAVVLIVGSIVVGVLWWIKKREYSIKM